MSNEEDDTVDLTWGIKDVPTEILGDTDPTRVLSDEGIDDNIPVPVSELGKDYHDMPDTPYKVGYEDHEGQAVSRGRYWKKSQGVRRRWVYITDYINDSGREVLVARYGLGWVVNLSYEPEDRRGFALSPAAYLFTIILGVVGGLAVGYVGAGFALAELVTGAVIGGVLGVLALWGVAESHRVVQVDPELVMFRVSVCLEEQLEDYRAKLMVWRKRYERVSTRSGMTSNEALRLLKKINSYSSKVRELESWRS